MKKKITLGKIATVVILLALSLLVLNFNDSLRVPSIFDGKFYTTALIKRSDKPAALAEKQTVLPDLSLWLDSISAAKYQYPDFFLQNTSTTSFLVMRNDTVIFKRYLNGIKEGENTQLFSVTKVFVTALLGMAIQDKYISDINVPVTNYFTDLKDKQFQQLTLRHLTQMESGLNYDEYGKIFQTLQYYYNKNLTRSIYGAQFDSPPGKQFKYKSIDTQILGECIKKALGKKKILDYFYERLWNKLGMQDTAYWALDSRITRNPKYYGGLNMSARDLAKFGTMILHDGKYKRKQLLPKEWFNYCDDTLHRCKEEDKYCMGWYYSVDDTNSDVYYAAGFNGQIMLINETKNVIVIRLGKDRGGVDWYPIMKKLTELV
ncbi:MAG TPA: serine hydrolase [Chitinophagales bacterium]|nr:serine hydrolase [Chitinophagales bacterium]